VVLIRAGRLARFGWNSRAKAARRQDAAGKKRSRDEHSASRPRRASPRRSSEVTVFKSRPLKRVIQKEVLDELARLVLGGELREGETVVIDAEGGRLTFHANLQQAPLVALREAVNRDRDR